MQDGKLRRVERLSIPPLLMAVEGDALLRNYHGASGAQRTANWKFAGREIIRDLARRWLRLVVAFVDRLS